MDKLYQIMEWNDNIKAEIFEKSFIRKISIFTDKDLPSELILLYTINYSN